MLLATHNGSRFVESQIASLKANSTPFVLHWLDDHSVDSTREIVRATALREGIEIREWHQARHVGIPEVFFDLLECVEADLYLFCDQDDIWQPGKIDATVANLAPDVDRPALVFSDPLVFKNDDPSVLKRFTEIRGVEPNAAIPESCMFMYTPAMGHTIGFTRPLREIFLKHADIARRYAFVHDFWMYLIANACGTSRMLSDVPTTLYRLHGSNAFGMNFAERLSCINHIRRMWRLHQMARRLYSRQAQGFCQAYKTLPPGPKLDRLQRLAAAVSKLDRRQSPAFILRLLARGAMPPIRERAFWFAVTCLFTNSRKSA